ncbi:cytochrome P450 1A2-like [Aplysia californica]|uniref:Cytochrome P450 1A2-like n=1 Tax=Aplysia californica TaxID=6500 RepID=A0ABM1AFE8_APLCA|nr:cytochrome P450 1A2-like [Aplysia californica]
MLYCYTFQPTGRIMIADLILFCLVLTILFVIGVSLFQPRKGKIPGPPFLYGLRTVLASLRKNNLHVIAETWAKQYGDLVEVDAGLNKIVFINDPELVRRLFCDLEWRDITNDRPPTFMGEYICGNYMDILTANFSPGLTKRRKLFHNALKFYGEGVHTFESLMQKTTGELVGRIKQHEGNVPLFQEIVNYICFVVGVILKGENTTDADLDIIRDMNTNINKCFRFENETLMRYFPFLRFVPGLRIKKSVDDLMFSAKKTEENFFWKIRESSNRSDGKDSNDGGGIVACLLEMQKKMREENLPDAPSDAVVVNLIIDVLGGAYLSTASSLTSLFLNLIKNQKIQDRIHEEIEDVIGDEVPSFEHRRLMPYTEAAILESFRISSVSPFSVPHFANNDFTVDGRTVKKGSVLLQNTWYFHHSEDLWPDPWTLKPERFLDESGQLLDSNHPVRRNLIVFGTGRRICPGESLARSRVFLILVTLLQKYRFLPPSGVELPSSSPINWTPDIVFFSDPYMCKVEAKS